MSRGCIDCIAPATPAQPSLKRPCVLQHPRPLARLVPRAARCVEPRVWFARICQLRLLQEISTDRTLDLFVQGWPSPFRGSSRVWSRVVLQLDRHLALRAHLTRAVQERLGRPCPCRILPIDRWLDSAASASPLAASEYAVQIRTACSLLDRKSTRLNSSHANISY